MSNEVIDIKAKIAAHQASRPLTRAEKIANKDTVQKKASVHEDKAIAALAGLLSDRRAPATAKARAADILLDRMAGKAVKHEESQRPEGQFDKMSEGQLIAFICETIHGLPHQLAGQSLKLFSRRKGISVSTLISSQEIWTKKLRSVSKWKSPRKSLAGDSTKGKPLMTKKQAPQGHHGTDATPEGA